jgi:hydrogenase maturation factor
MTSELREPAAASHLGDVAADLAATALVLARRFAAGATMWCLAPSTPHHARHLAVEFVHPVIVGKRALPAVAIGGGTEVATLRASVRADDLIVAIGPASDAAVTDVCRRAPAWGASTVWIGAGPRPTAGAADHVLWLDDAPSAAHDGRFILLYHLLWELTHVCFEHPGSLDDDRSAEGEVCITCADEGRLAEVLRPGENDALVRTARGQERVDTSLVGSLEIDDLVLVHAGTAITRLDLGRATQPEAGR